MWTNGRLVTGRSPRSAVRAATVSGMPNRLASVVVDVVDPAAAAEFWYVMLGGTVVPEVGGGRRVVSPEIGVCDVDVVFLPSAAEKVGKNRIHVDLATESPHEYQVLTSLAMDLGAVAADGETDLPWTVFHDPVGNEFCILEPHELYSDTGPLAAIVIDAADPVTLADFWSTTMSWPTVHHTADAVALRPAGTHGPWIEFLRAKDSAHIPNRIRFTVTSDTPRSLHGTAFTATDPEGNEFHVHPAGHDANTPTRPRR